MKDYRPTLDRLAMLARERPNLLAGPLHLYKKQEGLNDEQLAALLGCELAALPRLALCERPRSTPHFREDVERIASYIHADMLQLAMVIRAAETREALSSRPATSRPALLAARDNDESEESQDPDADTDEHETSDGLYR